ncbi:hypothetical protein [Actinophytocola sp.]|uniref:hypothetical protein n=1 Tax=Actinophytocola sp. TaxID=1872138 RepID=UPI003D6B32DD
MKQRQPQAHVMLDIPDCVMQGSFTADGQILIILGWPKDRAMLQFKRRALRRFIRLATDLLADLPTDGSTSADRTHLSTPT